MWVVYKPNPHNVTAEQISVVVNDPNNPDNTELKDEYPVEYTLGAATKELFKRITDYDDKIGAAFSVLGSPTDLTDLDNLDGILDNNAPTLIALALDNKRRLDEIDVIDDDTLSNLVGTYFNLNGGTSGAGEGSDSGDGAALDV
jgi:hypothetical protein